MRKLYSYKASVLPASVKDVDPNKGIVTGYFSAFNNKDADGDIIIKGAFAKTIQENGPNSASPRIKHLLNHSVSLPLGKPIVLQEDQKGLYYESQIGTHTLGQDFLKMVESGLITEHSIGFKTIKEERDEKDVSTNYIKEVKLWEGSSLTAWGSNPDTPLTGMKSLTSEQLIGKQAAIEKFCRNSTATDETIEMLLLHSKQLSQIILDLQKEATKPPIGTLPDNEIKEVFKTFINSLK